MGKWRSQREWGGGWTWEESRERKKGERKMDRMGWGQWVKREEDEEVGVQPLVEET